MADKLEHVCIMKVRPNRRFHPERARSEACLFSRTGTRNIDEGLHDDVSGAGDTVGAGNRSSLAPPLPTLSLSAPVSQRIQYAWRWAGSNQPVASHSCNAEPDPVNSPVKSLDKVTIYHNPRCSKSRQTLALIEDAGASPTVVKYLETPVSRDTLAEWVARSGLPASAFLRPGEKQAKALGITATSDPEAILDAIAQNPSLMERPVVVTEKGVILGRPPENVKDVL